MNSALTLYTVQNNLLHEAGLGNPMRRARQIQRSVMKLAFCAFKLCCRVSLHLLALAMALHSGNAQDLMPILNGTDLTGWKVPDPNPFWKVTNGVLVGQNDEKMTGHVLYTEKSYGDFVLESDVRWEGEIDSGFMLRIPELQLQIGVSRSLKKDMTCCFYTGGQERYPEAGRARDLEKVLKPGGWNKFRLQAKGDVFTVWLNGEKVTEYSSPKYKDPGPIGLQIHPGLKMKVEFKDIRLKELP